MPRLSPIEFVRRAASAFKLIGVNILLLKLKPMIENSVNQGTRNWATDSETFEIVGNHMRDLRRPGSMPPQ